MFHHKNISDKPFRIKASFNNLRRDFLYLQLEYATIDSSNGNYKASNNIFLDMGSSRLFKEIIDDKSSFKHKISILDKVCSEKKNLN